MFEPIRWLAVALIVVAVSSEAMATRYRWQCVFTQRASPKGLVADNFSMEIALDDVTGKAVIIGNQGVEDVEAYKGPYGVTFMERLPTGVVQTTTIANGGKSVHSRHTIFGPAAQDLSPSQMYGQCRLQ